jgi:hypothetical protein
MAHTERWDAESDYCHPTTCPECGAQVFFVRHNGGSVWLDALGWPWPKHGCFDYDSPSERKLWDWVRAHGKHYNSQIGIISSVTQREVGATITIDLENTESIKATISDYSASRNLVGALVLVVPEEKRILDLICGELPVVNFRYVIGSNIYRFTRFRVRDWEDCPICRAGVVKWYFPEHLVQCQRLLEAKMARKKEVQQPKRKSSAHLSIGRPAKKVKPPKQTATIRPSKKATLDPESEKTAGRIGKIVAGLTQNEPASARLELAKALVLERINLLPSEHRKRVQAYLSANHWQVLAEILDGHEPELGSVNKL